MIDGSAWMLKSTEPEHVSAAQPRPSTQHLFKGQVLQNTLAVQLLPLSYQISHREVNKKGKSPLSFEDYNMHYVHAKKYIWLVRWWGGSTLIAMDLKIWWFKILELLKEKLHFSKSFSKQYTHVPTCILLVILIVHSLGSQRDYS